MRLSLGTTRARCQERPPEKQALTGTAALDSGILSDSTVLEDDAEPVAGETS